MRSWTLCFSATFASVMAVSSLVIQFCLFLNFYHGDLFSPLRTELHNGA